MANSIDLKIRQMKKIKRIGNKVKSREYQLEGVQGDFHLLLFQFADSSNVCISFKSETLGSRISQTYQIHNQYANKRE